MQINQEWIDLGMQVLAGVVVGGLVAYLWAAQKLRSARNGREQEKQAHSGEMLALNGAFENQSIELAKKSEAVIKLEGEVSHTQGNLEDTRQRLKTALADVDIQRKVQEDKGQELSDTKAGLQSEQARSTGFTESRDNYKNWREISKADLKEEAAAHGRLRTEHQELKTTLEQKEEHFAAQLTLLNESREQLKKV